MLKNHLYLGVSSCLSPVSDVQQYTNLNLSEEKVYTSPVRVLLHWVTAWTCQKGQRQCSFHSSKCFYRVRGDWIRSLSSGGTKCTQFISENNNRKWFSGRNPANTAALRFKSTQAQWGGRRGDGVIGVSWRFRRNLRVFCHLNPLPRSSSRRSNMKRVACSQHHLLFQEHRQQQSLTAFIKDHTPKS